MGCLLFRLGQVHRLLPLLQLLGRPVLCQCWLPWSHPPGLKREQHELHKQELHKEAAGVGKLTCAACAADGFGDSGHPPDVPPGATLEGEITLISWKGVQVRGPASLHPCFL